MEKQPDLKQHDLGFCFSKVLVLLEDEYICDLDCLPTAISPVLIQSQSLLSTDSSVSFVILQYSLVGRMDLSHVNQGEPSQCSH